TCAPIRAFKICCSALVFRGNPRKCIGKRRSTPKQSSQHLQKLRLALTHFCARSPARQSGVSGRAAGSPRGQPAWGAGSRLGCHTRWGGVDANASQQTTRERDAHQLARRILSLVNPENVPGSTAPGSADILSAVAYPAIQDPKFQYRDVALLFRAMTDVPVYESVFRRANIPYQTVLGKG